MIYSCLKHQRFSANKLTEGIVHIYLFTKSALELLCGLALNFLGLTVIQLIPFQGCKQIQTNYTKKLNTAESQAEQHTVPVNH